MIELTVKRPNGETEKVATEFVGMTKVLFAKIQEATKKAGRGDVLSWELIDTRTDNERAETVKQDKIAAIEYKIRKAHETNQADLVYKYEKELESIR